MDNKDNFLNFVADKDGDYSKARFMSLAQELLREGRRPDRVFLAMYRAAATSSLEHSISDHRDFIITVHREVSDWLPDLEAKIDQILDASDNPRY